MKANVIIRMGAPFYDVRVRDANGNLVRFDLRAMDKNGRRNFHREFMNAYRQNRTWSKAGCRVETARFCA